jgi:hypothetical protein
LPTPHPKVRVAKLRDVDVACLTEMLEWLQAEAWVEDGEVRAWLGRCVPEYRCPDQA